MESYCYQGKTYYCLDGVRLAWSLTHYDGPMSGIALYRGSYYYAKCHQSPVSRKTRYFWLYPLTPEEVSQEKASQEAFRKYVSYHCDYRKDGSRRTGPSSLKEWIWKIRRSLVGNNTDDYRTYREQFKIDRSRYLKREAVGYFAPFPRD